MNRFLIVFFALSFFFKKTSDAQITFSNDAIILQKFHFEDKQMSEFFDRFNFSEPMKFADSIKSTRTRNIISLFNLRDTAMYHNPETLAFLKFVSNDSSKIYLKYGDSCWFAFAHCAFIYHSKNIVIDVILKPEGNIAIGYKWVIKDVKSEIFPIGRGDTSFKPFINPVNHEVGFSELSKALIKRNTIFQFTATNYNVDPLSAFLFMVKNGDIKFSQINSVDFQFLQINGWAFTVKNFNRVNYNSGWLISSLKKMSNGEKIYYIKNHFIN